MNHQYLTWNVAKNRLASGFYPAVRYQNGRINMYIYEKGCVKTLRWGVKTTKPPQNPGFLFRRVSYEEPQHFLETEYNRI